MQDRTLSRLLLFRCWLRFCASCARDSTGRRANVAPGRFALFASCSPDVSYEGRVQIVFGDNRASRVNYCEFSCRGAAVFESRPRRSTKAHCHGRIVAPAVVNESLTRPNHRLFFVPVLLPARSSRRAARLVGASPAVCGRATAARSFSRGRPAAAHIASAFCSRVTQYSHALSTPREPRL